MIHLKIVHELVKKNDNYLGKVLDVINGPMFAMSWILTWFSHSFKDLNKIQRVFDYLLCSEPQTIAYLSAALIITTKQQLIQAIEQCEEGNEVDTIFYFYQDENLNKIQLDYENWFETCNSLQKKYKFSKIRNEHNIPKDSNLFEDEFNKLLEYRKDLQGFKISKTISNLKQSAEKVGVTTIAAGIIGTALIYYSTKHLGSKLIPKSIKLKL